MKNFPYCTDDEVRAVLRALVASHGSATKLAAAFDFSAPYISDVLAGRRDVSAALASKMGYDMARVYFPRRVTLAVDFAPPDPAPAQPEKDCAG